VQQEIWLARHKAAYQEQQLQIIERSEAKDHRRLIGKFSKKSNQALEEAREWRIQRDRRATST
jgi:hypothetical protein